MFNERNMFRAMEDIFRQKSAFHLTSKIYKYARLLE